MKRNDLLSSPHLQESKLKRRKALIRKTSIILGLVVALLVSLGLVSRIEKINISSIKVEGNKVADAKTLEDFASQVVSGNYLWIFPKTNLFFYPKGQIQKRLQEEFKILSDIAISIEKDRSLLISVDERAPEYTWCGNTIEQFEEAKCYFMDNGGYVFSPAPYFSGDVYFRFFGALDGEVVEGSRYMPDKFTTIASFIKSLKDIGLKPSALLYEGDKLDFYLSGAQTPPNSPKIILDKEFNLEQTVINLNSILSTEPFQSDFKKKYGTLEYIDLSFGNKVYYRFK